MELVEVAKQIQAKIRQLEAGRKELSKRATRKAEATAEYEKALAITILKLKNNAIDQAFGMNIDTLPATLIEKTARGLVYEHKLAMESAEADYKSAIVGMQALEAELNGYQSVNRYLQHEA